MESTWCLAAWCLLSLAQVTLCTLHFQSATCLYAEEDLGMASQARRKAAERRGLKAGRDQRLEVESLEFELLELEAGGSESGQDQGQAGNEERAFVVEVLQSWLDRRQAKKDMRAAVTSGEYGTGAKERLNDLKMRVGSLQTQRV